MTPFDCKLCPLHQTKGDRYVLGNGNLKAQVVIIGDAPSRADSRTGIPMSSHEEAKLDGDVDLLVKLLTEAGIPPQEVFRTTLVKCRPPVDDYGNVAPVKENEIAACAGHLDRELSYVKPRIVITLGAATAKRVLDAKSIASVHGRTFDSAQALGLGWALSGQTKTVTRAKQKLELKLNNPGAFTVLPTYSFAMVRRDLSYLEPIRRTFMTAGKLFRGEKTEDAPVLDYHYAYTEPDVFKLLGQVYDKCQTEKRMFFDIETSGLNWYKVMAQDHVAKQISVAFGFGEHEVWSVTLRDHVRSPRVMKLYRQVLESDIPKAGHNGKFDNVFIRGELGIRVKNYDFDTMLAAWQLDQGARVGLDTQVPLYRPDLGYYWEAFEKKYKDSLTGYAKAPDDELLPYNAKDVDVTATLYKLFEPELKKRDLWRCFTEITMPHQAEAEEMEFWGAPLDVEATKELGRKKLKELDYALGRLYELSGKHPEGLTADQLSAQGLTAETYKPFNPGSGPQLAKILYQELGLPVKKWTDDTKKTPSVDEEALEALAGKAPFIEALLQYRSLKKQLGTYIGWERREDGTEGVVSKKSSSALLAVVDVNGRIHTSINIHGTATGRTSSSDPNLQNIPKTAEFRGLFKAPAGYRFGDSDYASLELRILAYESGDLALIKAFTDNVDLHSATGAGIFGLSLDMFEGVEYWPDPKNPKVFELFKDVDELKKKYPQAIKDQIFIRKNRKERKVGKNINFGVVYGKGAASLASELEISKEEAQSYLDGWSRTYVQAAAWIQKMFKELEKTGRVRYSLGRERRLPTIFSNRRSDQNEAKRQCINTPIQGEGSDCTSLSVIAIGRRLRKELGEENARLILEIHDQVVVEFKDGLGPQVQKIVVEEMERPKPMLNQELGLALVAEYGEVGNLGESV